MNLSLRNKLHRAIAQYAAREDYLPTVAEQRAKERREKLFRRIFKVVMWLAILAGGIAIGYNAKQAQSHDLLVASDVRERAAHVALGHRICRMDWREGCSVCASRTDNGIIISTHC